MKFILINSHDTGIFIQPYNNTVSTPSLLKLSEEGCLFTKAFTTSPTCSPSRCSLFTGQFPHERSMYGLANMNFFLDSYENTLVSMFNDAGFKTALAGVQHIAKDSRTIGYQYVLDKEIKNNNSKESYTAKYVLGDSYPWDYSNAVQISRFIKENKNKDFFISYGLGNTHRPFKKNTHKKTYTEVPCSLPDNYAIKKDFSDFCESVKHMDECIGVVLDSIKEEKLENETTIIYTTDHGIAFPNMKCTLFDSGTHISLIIKSPYCNYNRGRIVNSLVSNLDIVPTLAEIADLKINNCIHGKSLKPLIDNTKTDKQHHKFIFSEINYHISYQPMRSVRTDRFKYIYYPHTYPYLSLANIDDSPTKSFLLNEDLDLIKQNTEQLYDLFYDPNEKNNLIYSNKNLENEKEYLSDELCKKYVKTHEYLKKVLFEWMNDTNDPLLDGTIPLPKGSLVWKNECIDHNKNIYRNGYSQADY